MSQIAASTSASIWAIGADLKVHDEAKVIAQPNTLDWPVEGKVRSVDQRAGLGMSVPASDENIVEAAAMTRLPHNLLHAGAGVRVIDRPGVSGPFASNGPSMVIEHAAPFQRLPSGKLANACGFIEITRDDGRKVTPVPRIEIRGGNRLAKQPGSVPVFSI